MKSTMGFFFFKPENMPLLHRLGGVTLIHVFHPSYCTSKKFVAAQFDRHLRYLSAYTNLSDFEGHGHEGLLLAMV